MKISLWRDASGWMLAAVDEAGLRALLPGNEPEAVRGDFRRRFPGIDLDTIDPIPNELQSRIRRALEESQRPSPIALAPRGTAFQRRVWSTLQRIPSGKTVTYRQLAIMMGQPQATRAVASACGANPIAILIPCHRVIRSDGGLGGYRWGIDRKRRLLDGERRGVDETLTFTSSEAALHPSPSTETAAADVDTPSRPT